MGVTSCCLRLERSILESHCSLSREYDGAFNELHVLKFRFNQYHAHIANRKTRLKHAMWLQNWPFKSKTTARNPHVLPRTPEFHILNNWYIKFNASRGKNRKKRASAAKNVRLFLNREFWMGLAKPYIPANQLAIFVDLFNLVQHSRLHLIFHEVEQMLPLIDIHSKPNNTVSKSTCFCRLLSNNFQLVTL